MSARSGAEPPVPHPGHPQHVERLASYWAEVFGGPPVYSQSCGGHSAMLGIHAGQGAERTSENASFGASSRPQMMRGFPTTPTSAPPCGRTWSGLSRRCSRTRPMVLRCGRTFRSPAGPGTDCRTPAQVGDLIRSRQVSRLSLPDPARRRRGALRGLACLRDPAKTEPLACPRSNDQNLWMALGAVTRRSAPSRG